MVFFFRKRIALIQEQVSFYLLDCILLRDSLFVYFFLFLGIKEIQVTKKARERISQTFVLFKEMPDKETDNSSQEIFQVSLNQSLQQLRHEIALYQRWWCQPSLFVNHKKIVVCQRICITHENIFVVIEPQIDGETGLHSSLKSRRGFSWRISKKD